MINVGEEILEDCNRNGCLGKIDVFETDGGCPCHTGNPPCGHCTYDTRCCTECDWLGEDDGDFVLLYETDDLLIF